MNLTYSQIRRNTHEVGGTTQAEATAKMTGLARKPRVFLNSILTSLRAEAAACHTEADYTEVRAQVERVRAALITKDAR